MISETALQRLAQQYRDEGYTVIVDPSVEQLPSFAVDFGMRILASRGKEKVLVQVKKNRAELEQAPDIPKQAEITHSHPGWRYDLVLLEPDDPQERAIRGAAEPTDEQLHTMLDRAQESRKCGGKEAALLLLWGSLEAAMRRYAHRGANGAKRELQPRVLLNQLYSSGEVSREEFDRLSAAWKIRTEIAHGFVAAGVDDSMIQTMIDVTKRLMEESRAIPA